MTFAPQIRRYILQALEESIVPVWQSHAVMQVLAQAPMHLDRAENWAHYGPYLESDKSISNFISWYWEEEKMAAGKFPFFGFIYEGAVDHRIAVTQSLAAQIEKATGKKPPGLISVRLKAPAFIYFAPGVPGTLGADPALELPPAGDCKIIWASVMDEEVRIHYYYTEADQVCGSHSIQLQDAGVIQLLRIYAEENQSEFPDNRANQSLLLIIAKRILRQLKQQNTTLANSAFALPNIHTLGLEKEVHSHRDSKLCRTAMEFVEKRLHDKLNREEIAAALHVSPDYLGRVFQHTTGVSLMRYVTSRRIEAAKLVLANGTETIGEITQLVGFSSTASFSGAFKRATGYSPIDYRRLHR
jgi:AraC-like DNA-binding protein